MSVDREHLHALRRDYVDSLRDPLRATSLTDYGTYCGVQGFVVPMDPDGGLSGVTCDACRVVIAAENIVRSTT